MSSPAYADLHKRIAAEIDAEIQHALEELGPASTAVRRSISGLLRHQRMKYPVSVLPLLVHGAETGAPEPAVPLSAVHVLWWASACYLDDLADGRGANPPRGLGADEALLAAVLSGQSLPIRIVQAQSVSDALRNALTCEIVNCGIGAMEGQLRDLRGDLGAASPESVVETYRGKSGAPYGMITAMAAILAGADHDRTELWREFGDVFGVLWQLFNDQEDLLSGRDEDLRNGTVTYLLACALDEASPVTRARLVELGAAARESDPARDELRTRLLAPAVLHRYEKDLGTYRDEAYRVLDRLGGHAHHVSALRELVDQSAGMYLT